MSSDASWTALRRVRVGLVMVRRLCIKPLCVLLDDATWTALRSVRARPGNGTAPLHHSFPRGLCVRLYVQHHIRRAVAIMDATENDPN